MRAALLHQLEKLRRAKHGFEFRAQVGLIQADAKAILVQGFDLTRVEVGGNVSQCVHPAGWVLGEGAYGATDQSWARCHFFDALG
jgi:hypothetical protein